MALPLRKSPLEKKGSSVKLDSSERILKLVRPTGNRRRSNRLLWSFLLGIAIVTWLLLHYGGGNDGGPITPDKQQAFFGLTDAYRKGGIDRYLEEKTKLRKEIAAALNHPRDESEADYAANVAVYLFPDILPDSDWEKKVAMEEWAPLETAIEKAPRTPDARIWYEEMRADIWNYENPRLEQDHVSPAATEVLRIYGDMSSQ